MSTEQHEYLLRKVSVKDLSEELNALWQKLQRPDSDLREEAVAKGIDVKELDELSDHELGDVISLRKGAGLDPATIALIVAFAPVGAKITKDLWEKVFLPRIKRRFGENTIESRDASEEDGRASGL